MAVQFFDLHEDANPRNGSVISNEDEFSELLDGFRGRKPFFFELVWGKEFVLQIGFGANGSCVQHSPSDGDPPYLLAVAAGSSEAPAYMEFLCGNTPTPVWVRYRLSHQMLKQIVAYFLESGGRGPVVEWEEVGPASVPEPAKADEAALYALFEVSTPGAVHRISHYLYFASQVAAAPVAAELNRRGFEAHVSLGAYDKWLIVADHEIVPTEKALTELRQSMETLALAAGGEYDGWEALVQSE
jgi:hypothetical protein